MSFHCYGLCVEDALLFAFCIVKLIWEKYKLLFNLKFPLSLFQHQLATQRIMEEKESVCGLSLLRIMCPLLCSSQLMDKLGPQKSTSFNLYVNVKNFVCRVGDDADILIALYDAKDGQFLRCDGFIVLKGLA